MDDLNKYAFRIRTAMNKIQREINIKMQSQFGLELTRPQLYVLKLISDEEPCKMTDLAKGLGVNASTISTMINRLVQDGLISREYGSSDRRNVFVSITQRGNDVLKQHLQNYSEVLQQYLSHLEPKELETFVRNFEKIASISSC
ncbi:MarR family winged helix-turn-helix transcriptional regulator [Paenibacillus foliorum]|uniref:MarR family winged helix-turn-helix transcriptional regulator n=1 Tax=Paenibacillus foliorum TaxID=2654974 RepID=UPI0014918062|nr:MarR family transcriptional regulator [Paenibacillus foliorum]